jgi:hypothetical protein
MRHIFLLLLIASACQTSIAQIYSSKTGDILFHSTSPLEDIDGRNKSVKGILNTNTGDVYFVASITQFEFAKALMKEHFNENYLESEKYPDATYKGKINEKVDYTKDGVYPVTTTGKFKIHGVEKESTEKGSVTVKGKTILLHADMKIKVADYNIEIPKLVIQNIAEVVDVKVDIPLIPYVKEEKK